MSPRTVILTALLASACAATHPSLAPPQAAQTYGTGDAPVADADEAQQVVVEASATVAVADVPKTAQAVSARVEALGGRLARQEFRSSHGFAGFRIRLPPGNVDALFATLEELGSLRDRTVSETDVSKEMVDTQIQLENLRHALNRYRAILAAATDVEEMLAVERELTRIRGEIERIQGERAYLADRVALATVELTVVRSAEMIVAEPKLYPGLRFSHFGLYRDGYAPRGLAGPGIAARFSGEGYVQLDLLTNLDGEADSVDGLVAGIGADVYSDYLGGGRRRFLNPHLGFFLGYAGFDGHGAFTGAVRAGVELLKTEYVLVDGSVRLHGLVGAKETTGFGVQSTLSLHVAF